MGWGENIFKKQFCTAPLKSNIKVKKEEAGHLLVQEEGVG